MASCHGTVNTGLPWQNLLDDKIKVETFLEAIDRRAPLETATAIFRDGVISERIKRALIEEAEREDSTCLDGFSRKIRIYKYLSELLGDEALEEHCYDEISAALVGADEISYRADYLPVCEEATVRLPVRVNFGGGWSDSRISAAVNCCLPERRKDEYFAADFYF